jgi:hypothetical protein
MFVAVAGLLIATSPAFAQKQRVYLGPQKIQVSASKPGILEGHCLDETVNGAPGPQDSITQFSRPSAILVHKMKGGKVVDIQNWSDVLSGKSKPWIDFSGAVDTGGVNIRAKALNEEDGVSYLVEVKNGLAVARPEEKLTEDLEARIRKFSAPIEFMDKELGELRETFGDTSPLRRLVRTYCQGEVVWATEREQTPEKAKEGTEKFIKDLIGVAGTGSPRTRYLMATLLAGNMDAAPARKEYFKRYGVELEDVKIPDGLKQAVLALHETEGVMDIAVWQMKALKQYQVPAVFADARRVFEKVLKDLDDTPDLVKHMDRMSQPTLSAIAQTKRSLDALTKPSVAEAGERDGDLGFAHPSTGAWLSLNKALETNGRTLPDEWKDISRDGLLFDLRKFDGDPAKAFQFGAKLQEVEKRKGVVLGRRFRTADEASSARLQKLLDVDQFDVRVGGDTFKSSPVGRLAAEILKTLKIKAPFGRSVEFVVEHENDKILDTLKEEADAERFKNKHLVVLVCMKDVTNPKAVEKFADLRKAALDKGAASVLMPTQEIDIPAATLAAVTLHKNPALLEGATPEEALRRACNMAALTLERCMTEDKKAEAAKQEFGAEAAKLLLRDGVFNDREAARILRRLPSVWQSTMLFVRNRTAEGDKIS